MEFDKSRVFTVFNLDEIKIGSKVYADDYRTGLIKKVESENENPRTLIEIDKKLDDYPFLVEDINGSRIPYEYVYLVEEPEEKKLKWTDLKIGDVIRRDTITAMVVAIDENAPHIAIADFAWLTDEALRNWEKVE